MNVFVKPNEQSEACFYSAMARKGAFPVNVFVKPNEQNEACFYSAMARKGAIPVNVSAFRVYAVVEKQNDVTRLSRNSNIKTNKETKQ